MSYTKDSLKKWAGKSVVRTTYEVPTIKFNGNTGKIQTFPVRDFKNGTEVTDMEITILRIRRVYGSYEMDKSTMKAVRMFTNEHNSWEDTVTLFEAREGNKVKAVGEGTIESLRPEFPSLKITSNVYCFYNNQVYKFPIRGKSRQMLVDKQKELAKSGTELFEKKLKVTVSQESAPGGNIYYHLNFEVVGDSNLDEIGPHMEDIGKVMDKIDQERIESMQRFKEQAELLAGGEEPMLPVEETSVKDPEEEIKVDEIPF